VPVGDRVKKEVSARTPPEYCLPANQKYEYTLRLEPLL
jgi:hypothetical protein